MTRNRMRLHCGQRPKTNLRPEALSRVVGLSHGSVESHFKHRICQLAARFFAFIILWLCLQTARHGRAPDPEAKHFCIACAVL